MNKLEFLRSLVSETLDSRSNPTAEAEVAGQQGTLRVAVSSEHSSSFFNFLFLYLLIRKEHSYLFHDENIEELVIDLMKGVVKLRRSSFQKNESE